MELIDEQRSALATMTEDFGQMMQRVLDLEKTEGGTKEGFDLCLCKMDAFEEKLPSDILLPHQAAALRSLVFAELVKRQGGDMFSALATYYPNQFQLEDSQKARMKEVKNTASDKIEKAKRELKQKLLQIAAETETEVRSVLTPKQSKLLTELQGPGTGFRTLRPTTE